MPFVLSRERRAHCEYWTCKPNSVEDDHSSRPAIADGLKRPTRKFRAPSRHACRLAPATSPLFGLAPCGVCHAPCIAARPVRSYRTFSPLPQRCRRGGIFSVALSVNRAGTRPPRRYLAHCSVEFGLSSPLAERPGKSGVNHEGSD